MEIQPFGVDNCSSSSCYGGQGFVRTTHSHYRDLGSYFITRPSNLQSATSEDCLVVKPLGPQSNQSLLVLPRDVQQVMIPADKRPFD